DRARRSSVRRGRSGSDWLRPRHARRSAMMGSGWRRLDLRIITAAAMLAGCAAPAYRLPATPPVDRAREASVPHSPATRPLEPAVRQVSAQTPADTSQDTVAVSSGSRAQASFLSVDELVATVLMRHPSLAEMTAAWQAASARYGQVTSLED